MISRAGVFVVDAKNWSGSIEVRGASVYQDGVARDERLVTLAYVTHRVEEIVVTSSACGVRPQPVICFATSKSRLSRSAGLTHLTDIGKLGDFLRNRPAVLTAEQVVELTELLDFSFPPYVVDEEMAALAEGVLFDDLATRHAGMQQALMRPVEDWMVWLHPQQANVSRRVSAGPMRIGGAAGTGKTSVGLHRLSWLATTRPGRFLVTSYVRTLPQILRASYERLSPRTVDRVEFAHVHGVAKAILASAGVAPSVASRPETITAACFKGVPELNKSGLSASYFHDEIIHVIKGRNLSCLDEYLALDRVGRGTPLRDDARRAVWKLFENYQEELLSRGRIDTVDLLRLARDRVRVDPGFQFAGVLVDEAQDLPLVGMQLLHELAGRDRQDGLLLIGDGQQAIYPGGFRLRDAGVEVSGRSVILSMNYRNTVEILATASAVVADDAFNDLDLPARRGVRDVEVVRHGETPTVATYATRVDMDQALLWDMQSRLASGARLQDVAVLVPTNKLVEEYLALLIAAGIEASPLADGPGGDGVQVGTWHRAKGMEFSHVFMPCANVLGRLVSGSGSAAQDEKSELMRRAKFVAMTRSRDVLWIGELVSGV